MRWGSFDETFQLSHHFFPPPPLHFTRLGIQFKFNLTFSFFPSFPFLATELLTDMANSCDLEVLTLEYVQRETVNLKKGLAVPRIFVQGKFRRKKRRTEGEEEKEEVVVEAVNSSTAN